MTQSFDVLSDLRLNKRLSKQSWRRWFETPSRSLWRHCNDMQRKKTWWLWWNKSHDSQGPIGVWAQPMRADIRYNVIMSVIGWGHAQNDPWISKHNKTKHDKSLCLFYGMYCGAHFTKYFSIVNQIRWEFHSGLIQVVKKVIAMKFCIWHDSCAVVACAKCYSATTQWSYTKTNFPSNLNYDWILIHEMSPWMLCCTRSTVSINILYLSTLINTT